MLPISLQNQILPGSLEHTIHEVVEKHMDLAVFNARCNNDDTVATAIHPKILLKIVFTLRSKAKVDVQWRLYAARKPEQAIIKATLRKPCAD
ncbi:MAG: hypothetical protein Kow0070_28030 [Anaerolineales bacterium]